MSRTPPSTKYTTIIHLLIYFQHPDCSSKMVTASGHWKRERETETSSPGRLGIKNTKSNLSSSKSLSCRHICVVSLLAVLLMATLPG